MHAIRWRFVLTAVLWAGSHAMGQQPSPADRVAPRLAGGRLYEGAFLADQIGRLASLDGGVTAVRFEPGPDGRAVPPMALLPCTTLQRMEQVRHARQTEPRFRVSGQVFLYKGRNYLMPTAYQVVGGGSDQADQAPPDDHPPGREADADPSVEALVGAIETLTPENTGADAPVAAPTGDLLPDGSYLRPRTGLVARSLEGALTFTIDNDPDADPAGPTALRLLPSRALELIESMLGEAGAPARFLLSGRVFQYQGRNYLLPSLVRVAREEASGLRPGR